MSVPVPSSESVLAAVPGCVRQCDQNKKHQTTQRKPSPCSASMLAVAMTTGDLRWAEMHEVMLRSVCCRQSVGNHQWMCHYCQRNSNDAVV